MNTAERRQAAERYPRLKRIRRDWNDQLVKMVSKEEMERCATLLGFMGKEGVLIFDCEEDAEVLYDFAIHECARNGTNAPQRLLARADPGMDPDARRVLQGLASARFGLYMVEQRLEGCGARVRNTIQNEVHEVVDVGLSQTASPGALFVGRLIDVGGFWISTGAVVPVLPEDIERAAPRLRALDEDTRKGAPNAEVRFKAMLMETACRARAYREHGDLIPRSLGKMPARPQKPSRPRRPSRNGPCPCGSGKRYKSCCGAREG